MHKSSVNMPKKYTIAQEAVHATAWKNQDTVDKDTKSPAVPKNVSRQQTAPHNAGKGSSKRTSSPPTASSSATNRPIVSAARTKPVASTAINTKASGQRQSNTRDNPKRSVGFTLPSVSQAGPSRNEYFSPRKLKSVKGKLYILHIKNVHNNWPERFWSGTLMLTVAPVGLLTYCKFWAIYIE